MISYHLDWLNRWNASHKKDPARGVELDTLPDGGWRLKVPIEGSAIAGKSFAAVKVRRTKNDWLDCSVVGQDFQATAGPKNLSEALRILRTWSDEADVQSGPGDRAA